MLIELENGSNIAAAVAVVGGRPNRDQRVVKHLFVAFHDQLMGTADEGEAIGAVEFLNHVSAKEVPSTTRTQAPSVNV